MACQSSIDSPFVNYKRRYTICGAFLSIHATKRNQLPILKDRSRNRSRSTTWSTLDSGNGEFLELHEQGLQSQRTQIERAEKVLASLPNPENERLSRISKLRYAWRTKKPLTRICEALKQSQATYALSLSLIARLSSPLLDSFLTR
jgi:hypothetical protein